ncbi:DVU_1551 family NTP transferase [Terrisporobacter sp.]
MKINGLIVAAGLSSRMKDFKPLMKIDNKQLILHTINSLKQSGIEDITIIVGYRKDDLEELLKNEKVNIIFNENFKTTSMYDSFKLGLKKIYKKCDAIAFLPGDVGFVSKYTMDLLIKEINKNENKIVYPTYKNKVGHPPIISAKCFDYLLNYNGNQGLKGGMECFKKESIKISTPDKFILFDMDYKEDFNKVKNSYENREILSYEDCINLLDYFDLPKSIVKHCEKVKEICIDLSEAINKYENCINIDLIKSAALLHDIKRLEKEHDKKGAKLLKDLGYDNISLLVKYHMKLENYMEDEINEKSILYFADKLVIGDEFENIEKRFAEKIKKYDADDAIKKNILKKYNTTLKIKSNIISIIGEVEYDKLEEKWRGK